MVDPLAEVVSLLQPSARYSKIVNGAGAWRVRRSESGRPFYCVILDGASRLSFEGGEPIALQANDFVLIPSTQQGMSMSSAEPATADSPEYNDDAPPVIQPNGEFRIGRSDGPANVRMLVGYCAFGSPDAALLVSLLPRLVHVRGESRLTTLVQWVVDESRAQRPAREVVLARLLEVLLIEALRSTESAAATPSTSPGLVRGLSDTRLAAALRSLHEHPTRPWTVAQLAKEAALSRSAFFDRFSRALGVAPMEYLLGWRMALAKDLLRRREAGIAEVAERVGYSSASTFSVAFTRHVGMPPMRYARGLRETPVALKAVD